jgi:hypothetical protein
MLHKQVSGIRKKKENGNVMLCMVMFKQKENVSSWLHLFLIEKGVVIS